MKLIIDINEDIRVAITRMGLLRIPDEMQKKVDKAIQHSTPLDSIRSEIESQRKEVSNKHSENDELQAYYDGLNDGLKDARDILDEYKAESKVRDKLCHTV